IVDLANRRFGSNGWSSAIRSFEVDFVDVNQNTGRVSIGLSAVVRLVLKDGTFHDNVGYGSVDDCPNKGMAFEQARKGAITDALETALGYFGDAHSN
ncbi:dsRNA-binding domain-like protein, partial [Corynespora cassiicola Philippines]